jgi:hypothetical protein
MKKLILFTILLACVNSYAINGFSIFKMYSQYDTVTHTNLDSNLNRPASWSSLLVDTLDKKFIRFYDLSSHDSTLPYVAIDSIRSNPNLDSTQGDVRHTGKYTFTDSINGTNIKLTGRGTGTDFEASDSIKGQIGSFSSAVSTSLVSSDSIANTGGISTARLVTSGSVGIGGGYHTYSNYTTLSVNNNITGSLIDMNNNDTVLLQLAARIVNGVRYSDLQVPHGTFLRLRSNDKDVFVIDSNQNVGIGTTSPQYPLHVVGRGYFDSIAIGGTSDGFGFKFYNAGRSYSKFNGGDTAVFVETTSNRLSIDSMKFGNNVWLDAYDTGSFPCTLSTAYVTVQQVGTIHYTVIGNQVTLRLPALTGTSAGDWGSQGELKCGSAPSIVTACDTAYIPTIIFSGNSLATRDAGMAYVRNGFTSIYFYQSDEGNWPTTGKVGWFRRTTFTYTKY